MQTQNHMFVVRSFVQICRITNFDRLSTLLRSLSKQIHAVNWHFIQKPGTRSQSTTTLEKTDVLIVGGGPAGLSAAIRIKQICQEKGLEYRVIVLDKGGEAGSHILSGNVFEPRALDELFPNWKEMGAPIRTKVTTDMFKFLTSKSAWSIPHPLVMKNTGKNYIISLGNLVQWLAQQAESLGVEIYSGIAGSKFIYNDGDGSVRGVVTHEVGIDKKGNKKANYEPGMAIEASITLLAEGAHGSLSKAAISRYKLRPSSHQTYGIGLKEIWEVDPLVHQLGTVIHTIGWPMDRQTYGGSFIYHAENRLLYIGLVIGLDYQNTYLNPYQEFQRFKHHPFVAPLLKGGKCISYGARVINEGGLQSIPKLYFPGGALIGCSAGFLNVPKIKGSHTAMKSGMIAAEAILEALSLKESKTSPILLSNYEDKVKKSWIWKELYEVRNLRPSFHYGLYAGILYSGIDSILLKGKTPWTFTFAKPDHASLKPASECQHIQYPKSDGILSFPLLENLSRSGTNHEEDQPCHLTLKDSTVPAKVNLPMYDGPEARYCPAGVYEYVESSGSCGRVLQINAQNCLHCKTCDIKDPVQNIEWVPPEGGGGPQYSGM